MNQSDVLFQDLTLERSDRKIERIDPSHAHMGELVESRLVPHTWFLLLEALF